MFGNDIFGMMGIVIVRTQLYTVYLFLKNPDIILERNKALLRESVGVVISHCSVHKNVVILCTFLLILVHN